MSRAMILLAVLVGCEVAPSDALDELPMDQAALPALVHTVVGLEPGQTAQFVVDGAGYGENVYVLFDVGVLSGAPVCPPRIGGQCLDLSNPLRSFGSAMADVNGRAVLEVEVPVTVALGTMLSTQAVVIRGVGGVDSLVSPVRTDTTQEVPMRVSWSFTGLPELGADYVYENWLVVDGVPASAGRFTVAPGGDASSTLFDVTPDQVARAVAFIVTIEPAVGDDPAPSATHILAGDLLEGVASLTVDHGAALATDFTEATGAYILQTPSTAAVAGDYYQGVWFIDPSVGAPSLNLPALPAGWAYEGWSVVGGVPMSTGKFVDPLDADWDGAGLGAGPDATPPVPGQDFITPAYDLRGGATVISVEPDPDDSAAPFVLKPLIDGNVEDVGAGGLQDLDNTAADNNPTGTAWFE